MHLQNAYEISSPLSDYFNFWAYPWSDNRECILLNEHLNFSLYNLLKKSQACNLMHLENNKFAFENGFRKAKVLLEWELDEKLKLISRICIHFLTYTITIRISAIRFLKSIFFFWKKKLFIFKLLLITAQIPYIYILKSLFIFVKKYLFTGLKWLLLITALCLLKYCLNSS